MNALPPTCTCPTCGQRLAPRRQQALSHAQAQAIRKAYVARRQGKQLKDLAARYGVSVATAWKAINGIAPYDRRA